MTAEELSTLILGIAGVAMQLLFQYFPVVSDWYQGLSNKGLVALGLDVIVGLALFGISCTPFAAELGVGLVCETGTLFLLLKSLFVIIVSQQGTYLVNRKS